MLIFLTAALCVYIARAKKGNVPKIRNITALEAIEEGVGRATEMGQPVYFFLAGQLFGGRGASGPLSGLEVLNHVSKLTARKDVKFFCAANYPETTALAQEVIRTAYAGEGRGDAFRPDEMLRYYPSQGGADKSAFGGLIVREPPALFVMMGDISTESVWFGDLCAIYGAMSIAGCQRETQVPFLVALCDYTLVGEELLVAGAYLSGNPLVLGSVAGQDITKYLAIGLALAGAILATVGRPVVVDFFKL